MNLKLKYKFKFHLKNCNVKTKWHKKKNVLTKVSEYIKNKPKKKNPKNPKNKRTKPKQDPSSLLRDKDFS